MVDIYVNIREEFGFEAIIFRIWNDFFLYLLGQEKKSIQSETLS